MVTEAPAYRCFLCSSRIDLELCEGRYIHAWKVTVCKHCLNCNPTGISPTARMIAKLNGAHIDVTFNAIGKIDWPEAVQEATRPPPRRNKWWALHGIRWKHA